MIARPSRWALLRVVVLSHLGAWVIPMPWQHADPQPEVCCVARLGSAASPEQVSPATGVA